MKTKERLAEDLRKARAPVDMIDRALAGYYDDYESPLGYPLHALVVDAEKARLHKIADKAKNGDYDGTLEEGRAWIKSDPEIQKAWEKYVG
jgi:hypothetical protein